MALRGAVVTRQGRGTRRGGTACRLTERDKTLLRSLERFRIARTRDLARLFFPGRHRDVVADRLRKLYDAGQLEVHVQGLAAENIYSLGPRSLALVRVQSRPSPRVPRQPWEHHLGIVDYWTRLAIAVHGLPHVRLVRVRPDWEVRAEGEVRPVVPDLVVDLSCSDGQLTRETRVVIELDRGTESLEVLRRKLRAWASDRGAWWGELGALDCTLVLATDAAGERRMPALRSLLEREWPGLFAVWVPSSDLVAELRKLSAGPFATSRHGNGRAEAGTVDAATPAPVAGGGLSAGSE